MALSFPTTTDAVLKQFYDESYYDLAEKDHPLFAMATKGKKSGYGVKVPVSLNYTAGRGGTFTTAQTDSASGGTNRVAFSVTPNHTYALETVQNEDMRYSDGPGGVVNVQTDAIEKCMRACSDDVEIAFMGDGYGTLGTITANSGAGPYVLTVGGPASWKFYPNQVLVSKATAAAASLDTGTMTVNAVDNIAGTITVTAAGGWTPTNTHVLGLHATMAASTSLATWAGLGAWIPQYTTGTRIASNDSFYGVNRSVSPTLLAGHAIDGRQLNVIDTVNAIVQSIANVSGARPDMVLMNPATTGKLLALLQNNKRYENVASDSGHVFFKALVFDSVRGPLMVHSTPFQDATRIDVLDSRTWHAPGPESNFIVPATRSGKPLELTTGDSAESRMIGTGYFYCTAPGFNGCSLITA